MKYLFPLLVAALLLASAGGCRGYGPFQRPPGSLQQQRLSATVHDPYPDSDAGPDVVGGRPREFAKPNAEPVRSRPLKERE